jgi:hypothetical protein
MPIDDFDSKLTQLPIQPKGVHVGQRLWDALKAANLIQMSEVGSERFFGQAFKLPLYKNVVLVLDPELNHTDKSFVIPRQSDDPQVALAATEANTNSIPTGGHADDQRIAKRPVTNKVLDYRNKRWMGRS